MINELEILQRINRLEREINNLKRIEIPAGFECVGAKYRRTTAQSINNSTSTIINYATITYDTHTAVTTGASWKFTAPIAGYYHVTASAAFASSTTWAETEYALFELHVNGAAASRIDRSWGQDSSGGAQIKRVSGADTVYLSATHYVHVEIYQTSGGALNLSDELYNYIAIERVG